MSITLAINDLKITPDDIERFVRKLKINTETCCWEWTAGRFNSGYGAFSLNGKNRLAHRVSWMIKHGPISDGLELNHSCDNKLCVNQGHLSPETHQKNMKDALARGLIDGSPNSKYKLTEADVLRIRSDEFEGMTVNQIGNIFGVTGMCICKVVLRKSWRNI